MKRALWLFWNQLPGLTLALIVFLVMWLLWPGRPDPSLPPLPPKVVTVEVVKEIPTPGPERVVDRIRFVTEEVPVENSVAEKLCPPPDATGARPDPIARIRVEGDKFEGLDAAGKPAFGWAGQAFCELKFPPAEEWEVLASAPISVEESSSQTLFVPGESSPTRRRLDLAVGWAEGQRTAGLAAYKRTPWRGRILPQWVGVGAHVSDASRWQVEARLSWER